MDYDHDDNADHYYYDDDDNYDDNDYECITIINVIITMMMAMCRARGKSAPFVQTHQSLVRTPQIVADSASPGSDDK